MKLRAKLPSTMAKGQRRTTHQGPNVARAGAVWLLSLGASLILGPSLLVLPAHGGTFDDEHPRERDRYVAFRLWVPDDLPTVRTLVVLVPGYYGDGRNMAADEAWQKFARENDAALLACFFQGQESATYQWQRLWSGQQFDQSLAKLAEKSLHPEVATAPIAMWGLSAGGQFTYNFACWKPERLVAFGISKGGHNFLDASPATLRLPGLFIVAAHDMGERVTNLTGLFTDGRRSGAPWCLVLEPESGHDLGRDPELVRAFFGQILKQPPARAAAWEGNLTTHEIKPLAPDHPPGLTSWLPDEATARLWLQFVKPKR